MLGVAVTVDADTLGVAVVVVANSGPVVAVLTGADVLSVVLLAIVADLSAAVVTKGSVVMADEDTDVLAIASVTCSKPNWVSVSL